MLSRAKFFRFMHAKMFVSVLKQFVTFTKSSFAFTAHVTSCQTTSMRLQTPNIAYKPPSNKSRTKKLKNCTLAAVFTYKYLTLFAAHAHLAVLGIEATACVTILDRIIRRPPVRGALFTRSGERRKSGI